MEGDKMTNKEGKEALTAARSNKIRDEIIQIMEDFGHPQSGAVYALLHYFEDELAPYKVSEVAEETEKLKDEIENHKLAMAYEKAGWYKSEEFERLRSQLAEKDKEIERLKCNHEFTEGLKELLDHKIVLIAQKDKDIELAKQDYGAAWAEVKRLRGVLDSIEKINDGNFSDNYAILKDYLECEYGFMNKFEQKALFELMNRARRSEANKEVSEVAESRKANPKSEELFNENLIGLSDAIEDPELFQFYKDVIIQLFNRLRNEKFNGLYTIEAVSGEIVPPEKEWISKKEGFEEAVKLLADTFDLMPEASFIGPLIRKFPIPDDDHFKGKLK